MRFSLCDFVDRPATRPGVFSLTLAAMLALVTRTPVLASVVSADGFANDSQFAKTADGSPSSFFSVNEDEDNINDDQGGIAYWGIHDPFGNTDDYDGDPVPASIPAYTGFSGNYHVGENQGQERSLPVAITYSNLDISGLTNLEFTGLFAATTDSWDTDDDDFSEDNEDGYIRVQYRIDSNSGQYTNLLWFSRDNDDDLAVDPDFDGDGNGTSLDLDAQLFTQAIAGNGSTIDLRILMHSSGGEGDDLTLHGHNRQALAFDSIGINGVVIPEPTTLLAASSLTLLALRRRR